MQYRPDIDGLRAVAVVPVVLFHAGIPPFGGGFVGVDVFFVISGFLITTLILGDIDAGLFRFGRFWLRRVRRILPALFVLMGFATIAFAVVYPPDYYRQFALSLVAQLVFVSNVVFWRESGYFGVAADTKPLLHTWSLSVEEQFYLFIPVLLFILAKLPRRYTWLTLAALVMTSLVLSVWSAVYEPIAGFFLLPTRAWELGIGALLAVAILHRRDFLRISAVDNTLGVLGILAILYAVFRFDQNTPFPSYMALFPCLGAAAIIWANRNRLTVAGHLLSVRPIVFIGLISYSLYLWHWTLLVLNRAISPEPPTTGSKIVAIAISIAAAYLSYRFVETPIRRNRAFFSDRRVVLGAVSAFAILTLAGAAIHQMRGFPQRFDAELTATYAESKNENPRRSECHARFRMGESRFLCGSPNLTNGQKPALAIWGDSHADALYPALEATSDRTGLPFVFASYPMCPPIPGLSVLNQPPSHLCRQFNEAMVDYALSNSVKAVLLIARFNLYVSGRDRFDKGHKKHFLFGDTPHPDIDPATATADLRSKLGELVRRLTAKGIKVYVVPQVPNMLADPPSYFFKAELFGKTLDLKRTREEFDARSRLSRTALQQPGVITVDLMPLLCDDDRCKAFAAGKPIYYDDHHLNPYGAMKTLPTFVDVFSRIKTETERP